VGGARGHDALARTLREQQARGARARAVQGEGGIRELSTPASCARARAVHETGTLLVHDEIQSGCGRTGRFLAGQHAGVIPDVVTLAKPIAAGLPMGACLTTAAFADTFQKGEHGSTFAGGPLVCRAALVFLDEVERGLLGNVQDRGASCARASRGCSASSRSCARCAAAASCSACACTTRRTRCRRRSTGRPDRQLHRRRRAAHRAAVRRHREPGEDGAAALRRRDRQTAHCSDHCSDCHTRERGEEVSRTTDKTIPALDLSLPVTEGPALHVGTADRGHRARSSTSRAR
jgi:hypothetical protein